MVVRCSDSGVLRQKIYEYKPVTHNYIYQTQDSITPLQLLSITILLSVFSTIKASREGLLAGSKKEGSWAKEDSKGSLSENKDSCET